MKKNNMKNKKSFDSFSFISMMCKFFKKSEKETLKKNRNQADVLNEHIVNWTDTYPVLINSNPNLFLSLVGERFGETFTDLQITLFLIFSGAYFTALRNLRFTFESMIHAVYLVDKYPKVFPDLFFEIIDESNEDINFQERLEQKLRNTYPRKNGQYRDITGFKIKIIDELSFLDDCEKEQLKKTYHKLSQSAHPSPNQIKKILNSPELAFTFYYNEKLFNECIGLADEVMDITFAIVLYKFPDLILTVKDQENPLLFDSLCRLPITKRLLDVNNSNI